MGSRRNLFIVLGVVGLVALLLYALLMAEPKRYNWDENFMAEGNQPYDLSIFKTLFSTYFPEREFNTIQRLGSDTAFLDTEGSIFVYIDGRAYIDSLQAARLRTFAEKGNTVLVSATNMHSLVSQLCEVCGEVENNKWVQTRKAKRIKPYSVLHTDSTGPAIHYQIADELKRYPWAHYDVSWCDSPDLQKAGGFEAIENDYINYISANVGAGRILLHSTPLIFTNYHIIKPEVLAHVERVLEFLPEGDIYFFAPEFEFNPPPNRPLITESPLRFILGNAPLRWAWYLLLALCLLYVISHMRRKQKPMEVVTRPENETLKYIDVISRFYQKEGRHKDIVALKVKMLNSHLRRRYRISPGMPDEPYYRDMSEKLMMEAESLQEFFKDLDRASNNSTLTDNELIAIDQKISEFYAKCP